MMSQDKKENLKLNGGFTISFGGDFKKDSIQIENLADPQITVNFNGESRKVSLTDLAVLLEIYG